MAPTILAVVNGKGGCGKTSCVSNLAVIWSTQHRRVLAVDLDAQGNLAVDLGVEDTDAGLALSLAIQGGEPVTPIPDVRPGLDLVAGGARTDQLAAALAAQAHREPAAAIRDVVDTVRDVAGYRHRRRNPPRGRGGGHEAKSESPNATTTRSRASSSDRNLARNCPP